MGGQRQARETRNRSERIWRNVSVWTEAWDRMFSGDPKWGALADLLDDRRTLYLTTWLSDNFGPQLGDAVRQAFAYLDRTKPRFHGQGPLRRVRDPEKNAEWKRRMEDLNESLSRYLRQAGPLRFRYKGFVIYNPTRLTDKIVKGGLDQIDQMVAMFRKRGVEDAITETVKGWTLDLSRHYQRGVLAGGWYDEPSKTIALAWLGEDGMQWGKVDHETLIHEIGHHIHLSYLHPEAKALWDKPWEGVGRFRPNVLDALLGDTRWREHQRSVKEIADKLDIPTEYGRESVYEDFAETFMEFVMRPHALSKTALFRMKQALARSNLYGKKVMRLARVVAARRVATRYRLAEASRRP